MLISGIPLFAFGVENWMLSIVLWAIFIFSFLILYVLGGHALIYGPHLFIFGFADLFSLPFRNRKSSSQTIDLTEPSVEDDEDQNHGEC